MHFVSGSLTVSESHSWIHSRKLFWQKIYSISMAGIWEFCCAPPAFKCFCPKSQKSAVYRINSNRKVSEVALCEDAGDLKGSLPFLSQST